MVRPKRLKTRSASGRGVGSDTWPGLYAWLRDRLSMTHVHGESVDYLDRNDNFCHRRSPTMVAFDNREPVEVQAFYATHFRPRLRSRLGARLDPTGLIRVHADDRVEWEVES